MAPVLAFDRNHACTPKCVAEAREETNRAEYEAREAQREKVRERQAMSAAAVHEALRFEGREELRRPWQGLAWSGLAAGISMGLSLVAEGVLKSRLPDAQWAPLVTKLGYPVGFIAVTLGRQQLYTETTLTAFLPWLHERTLRMSMAVLRLWAAVLLANLAGALFFAWVAAQPVALSPELRAALRDVGIEAARHPAADAMVRGILGGWLIALMVWLLPAAESARIWIIALITYVLASAGLTHIIAGSVEVLHVVITGDIHWLDYLLRFAGPTLAGNTIGGVVFVAALNHAQVNPTGDGVSP